jgi:putative DNA primase/helicase
MTDIAAATKPEWLPKIVELVGRYAGADAEACETICNKIGQWHGAEAETKARELIAARRARDAAAKLGAAPPAPKPVAPKPEPKAEVKPQAKPKPAESRPADAPPVLNPNAPYDIAGEYIQRHCMEDAQCVLWHWQAEFYRWSGTVYEAVPADVMRGQIYSFLHRSLKRAGGNLVPYDPDSRKVNEVLDALKSRLSLGVECQPPMWISTREPATDWVVFKNEVVNVIADDNGCWETRPLTPDLWVHSALGFDWDPDAECPTWMEFLGQVFPGPDMESINLLEEWMGLCMTEETKFQKGLLMIGQKRSGKSTISRVLQQLVGNPNYVGLSFNTWIYSENSKEVLIGKRVGVFADVRFKPGKQYGQNCARRSMATMVSG